MTKSIVLQQAHAAELWENLNQTALSTVWWGFSRIQHLQEHSHKKVLLQNS